MISHRSEKFDKCFRRLPSIIQRQAVSAYRDFKRDPNEHRIGELASSAASLLEGLEETLTLHRLNVFRELGVSFRTTNLIESVMARPRQAVSPVALAQTRIAAHPFPHDIRRGVSRISRRIT